MTYVRASSAGLELRRAILQKRLSVFSKASSFSYMNTQQQYSQSMQLERNTNRQEVDSQTGNSQKHQVVEPQFIARNKTSPCQNLQLENHPMPF
jgi:hypothetical protein